MTKATRHAQIVDDFLEAEIGDSGLLDELAEHVRTGETWQLGGDSCHLTVHGQHVTIENDFNDESATMSRDEFLGILGER
ncbi:hypothetical protein [Actinophytocola sp.]|uniref:hypothetical protein n=1 Tax=Actinophytocola sp. TaxID=1872138 RepID=UPI002ED78C76